jgi:hypothetical protein
VTENERDVSRLAEIGDPVPGEDALDGDGDVRHEGIDGALQQVGVDGHVFVKQGFAVAVEDADVHGFGVQIDAAVELVLLFVESHGVASFG